MQSFPKSIMSEQPPNDEEPIEEIMFLNHIPNLYEQMINLLGSYSLCKECLGRQFSYLASGTDNTRRAESLLLGLTMECHSALNSSTEMKKFLLYEKEPSEILALIVKQTHFLPAFTTLKKDSKTDIRKSLGDSEEIFELKHECKLCNNILLPKSIKIIAESIVEKCRGYEFENYLIGSKVDPIIVDMEDEIRSRFKVNTGESFKANLNRLVGKTLFEWWNKPIKYNKPDITILLALKNNEITIELQPISLFIKARYQKFVRNLPQTRWHCVVCRGKKIDKFTGVECVECGGTGLKYLESIHDLIGSPILKAVGGEDVKFHGAGREDYDARCIGSGRPFVIEIKLPKLRKIDLISLEKQINKDCIDRIQVSPFDYTSKKELIHIKNSSESTFKVYQLLARLKEAISHELFNEKMIEAKKKLTDKIIYQRTPQRVAHRRADKTRKKKIYEISGKFVDPVHIFIEVKSDGGTYIKELISGDNCRTTPSLTQIFGVPMKCVELDIVGFEEKEMK
jgi:tRNA pseudouridine synthase 10